MDVRYSFTVIWALAAIVSGCATCVSCGTESTHPEVIADPESYAIAHFTQTLGGDGILTTYYDDLNGDGVEEMLIATSAGAGNAGRPHLAFRKTEGGYILLGEFFAHPRRYRILEPTPEGDARLVIYHHLSCTEGVIGWIVHRDGSFVVEKTETVFAGDGGTDEGRRRCDEVFGR